MCEVERNPESIYNVLFRLIIGLFSFTECKFEHVVVISASSHIRESRFPSQFNAYIINLDKYVVIFDYIQPKYNFISLFLKYLNHFCPSLSYFRIGFFKDNIHLNYSNKPDELLRVV